MKTNNQHKQRLMAGLLIVAALGMTMMAACSREEEEEYELSSSISQVTKGNRTDLVNTETGETVVKDIKMDWVQAGHDSIAVFSKDKKRGYLNTKTGEIIVQPTYKHAWIFAEGLAGVVQNDMVGFINTRGEVVIDFRYPYRGNSLTEFVFKNGHCVVADATQKLGVIDTLGQWVIKPEWDDIDLSKDYVMVAREGEFRKQMDYAGHVLQDGVIDYIHPIYHYQTYTNLETGAPERKEVVNERYFEYYVCGRAGLMSATGEFITPPIYTDISGLSATLFRVRLQNYYSEILINDKGQVLTKGFKKGN